MNINHDGDIDSDLSGNMDESDENKQEFLDEQLFKTKATDKKTGKTKTKIKNRKKPFLLLGIALILIGSSCFAIVNHAPWLYVTYETVDSENITRNVTIEKLYTKEIEVIDEYDEKINGFFESYSNDYLGISSEDFNPYLKISNYISYILIAIGIIFTMIQIVLKFLDVEYKKYLILHSFFSAIAAIICIYFIFVSTKFFASFVLYLLNYNIISEIFDKGLFVFIAPVFLIFVFALGLKICFTTLKIDYNELEKIYDEKKPKKSIFTIKKKGGIS